MVVGERHSEAVNKMASGYRKNTLRPFVEAYLNTANDILNEGTDITTNIRTAFQRTQTDDALKRFFVENSFDEAELDAEEINEAYEDAEALYENDRQGIMEAVTGNQINPIVGMAIPMHKWIMMNMVFDKGGIPKFVAAQPKFPITQEVRTLIDTKGNELDFYRQQNLLTKAIDETAKLTVFDVTLPLTEDTEIVHDKLGGLAGADHLSIETAIYAVKVEGVFFAQGDLLPNDEGYIEEGTSPIAEADTTADVWVKVNYPFVPGYNMRQEFDRALNRRFGYQYYSAKDTVSEIKDVISGTMRKDRLTIQSLSGNIKEVRVISRIDTSNARQSTCQVTWSQYSEMVEIPSAIPINVPISPDEVKDISALFGVNQVTKIMSLMKTVLGNYKDDKIREHLDESFKRLPATDKLRQSFDFAPRTTYSDTHVAWRRETFIDFLDQHVTELLQVLNDPNMKVTIYGDPKLVRMITPTTYSYQSPGSIGPVELDYTKTVYTSDKRLYNFIGSDKLRGTEQFIIVLCPEGTDRIMYRIYDYQMYLSNEIRNADNPSLPAMHAFERWKFVEYTPVQGRIDILHPNGINYDTYDTIQVRQV